MKLIFSGDLMLGGDFINKDFTKNNFGDNLYKILVNCEYLITNFENIIGKNKNLREDKNLLLYCSLDTFKSYIKLFPHSVFCLGNNHINDFGLDGFLKTKNILNNNKILHYGAGFKKDVIKPLILDDKVILLNFSESNYFVKSIIATDTRIGCLAYNLEEFKSIVKNIDITNKILIVTLHWGRENSNFPTPSQIEISHELIDLGVDLIIGHHSHTIQSCERYKGKLIFYGLGNYFFPNFYDFKSGIYKSWHENNNRSIFLIIDIEKTRNLNVKAHGLKFNPRNFELRLDSKSIEYFRHYSNIFRSKLENNTYEILYQRKYRKKKKTSFFFEILYDIYMVMNIFKTNKYSYRVRLKKVLKLKNILVIIKLLFVKKGVSKNYKFFKKRIINFSS